MSLDCSIDISVAFDAAAGYVAAIADHLENLGDFSQARDDPAAVMELNFPDGRTVRIGAAGTGDHPTIVRDISPQMTRLRTQVVLWCSAEPLVNDISSLVGELSKRHYKRHYAGVDQRGLAAVQLALWPSNDQQRLQISFLGAAVFLCADIVGSTYLRRLLVDSARWFDPTATAELDVDGKPFDLYRPRGPLPQEFTEHRYYSRTLATDGALHRFVT